MTSVPGVILLLIGSVKSCDLGPWCDLAAAGPTEEAAVGTDVETDSRERTDEHVVYITG